MLCKIEMLNYQTKKRIASDAQKLFNYGTLIYFEININESFGNQRLFLDFLSLLEVG